MRAIHAEQIFGDVEIGVLQDSPAGFDAMDYWNCHRAELQACEIKIARVARRSAIGGAFVGGVAIYISLRTRWTVRKLPALTSGLGGAFAVGAGSYFVSKAIKSYALEHDLLTSQKFASWKENEFHKRVKDTEAALLHNLEQIMKDRGLIDPRYSCLITEIFMLDPRSDSNQTFYSEKVKFIPSAEGGERPASDLYSKAFTSDLLKRRQRFVQKIIASQNPTIGPSETVALQSLDTRLGEKYTQIVDETLDDIEAALIMAQLNLGPYTVTNLNTLKANLEQSRDPNNCDFYPFATVGQQQITEY